MADKLSYKYKYLTFKLSKLTYNLWFFGKRSIEKLYAFIWALTEKEPMKNLRMKAKLGNGCFYRVGKANFRGLTSTKTDMIGQLPSLSLYVCLYQNLILLHDPLDIRLGLISLFLSDDGPQCDGHCFIAEAHQHALSWLSLCSMGTPQI
jgi:hypothetical protein